MGDLSNEPSMEEILSSIKRIIAEDSEAALSPPRTRRAAATAVRPVADPLPEPEAIPQDEEVLELTEAVETETVAADVAAPAAEPVPATPATLVSDAAAEASRSQLAALSALVVKPEIAGNDTLEGLVREMLRPMVGQWLEARLPDIVERMVAREIARITERG